MNTPLIKTDTPVESYRLGNYEILVKREDLCAPEGAPPFSKIRGLVTHLQVLKSQGIQVVGYVETSVSMAGWGVAWACKALDMSAVIFDPQYKAPHSVLEFHRTHWKELEAEIIPIKAGMARVNWNICKRQMKELYGSKSRLLPLGLPLKESVNGTYKEALQTLQQHEVCSLVVNVGSGTIAAGIWKAVYELGQDVTVYGIMGRSGSISRKYKLIEGKGKVFSNGLFCSRSRLQLIDPGWQYAEKSTVKALFPCHAYYDLKAWEWLTQEIPRLSSPIMFWNIGH